NQHMNGMDLRSPHQCPSLPLILHRSHNPDHNIPSTISTFIPGLYRRRARITVHKRGDPNSPVSNHLPIDLTTGPATLHHILIASNPGLSHRSTAEHSSPPRMSTTITATEKLESTSCIVASRSRHSTTRPTASPSPDAIQRHANKCWMICGNSRPTQNLEIKFYGSTGLPGPGNPQSCGVCVRDCRM
ncbi:hypothetical protein B0H17DRAFT_1047287, partial [Mycena rosella]